MKVVQIDTTVVGAPWRELTFVELATDSGLRGVGEARMVNKTDTLLACIGELGERYVLGMDPFDVERLGWTARVHEYGRVGEVTATAMAMFDIACYDLMGQALGQPVWRLLGGQFRAEVPAYANGWYQGDRNPETLKALAAGVVDRGYRALKIDPFGAGSAELSPEELKTSAQIVSAVRDAIGPDVALMVEMHGRFTPSVALRVVEMLTPFNPEWVEEPVPPYNPASLQRVRHATRLPIATGERVHVLADFVPIFEGGLADIIQADLTHFGGFTGLRKLAGYADAYDLLLAPHNVCGPVGTAANVHFAIATPNYKTLEHFNDFADPWLSDLVEGAPQVTETTGSFALPTRPGLGVRLNREACAKHPRTRAHFNLFAEGWERRGISAATTAPKDLGQK
jgi:galactonate dehydratase